MTDKKANAVVDILANKLTEVKPETLSDKLTNVKAGKTRKHALLSGLV